MWSLWDRQKLITMSQWSRFYIMLGMSDLGPIWSYKSNDYTNSENIELLPFNIDSRTYDKYLVKF
jgi:hypothetical protein